jgi:squalene-hopene/tetraprenyl-beta-curcumene cyclase
MPLTRILVIGIALALSWALGTADVQTQSASPTLSPGLRSQLEASIQRGVDYLLKNQKSDGSWDDYPGITALAATAILKQPGNASVKSGPEVKKALAYLAGMAKPDGGIYDKDNQNYNTAVSMMALLASNNPEYKPLIAKAQNYIVGIQRGNGDGVAPEDKTYGGIGYNGQQRPDLPNLQYALEALKASGLSEDSPAWKRAVQFIQRTQNRTESNDQSYSLNDGGFAYSAGLGWQNTGLNSYGSMTYAGILSYSYANVKKGDPRVEAAVNWIREHYTVEENPGVGQKTVYYYYMVFAKALQAYGEPVIVDARNRQHNWREDLGKKLLQLQHPEGYWVNTEPAEWQDRPVLVTSFVIIALEHILQ